MLSCTATVRNTGNVRLSSITLTAPGGGSCTPDTPILLPNMTASCTVSQAATQENFENGGMNFAVIATATPSGTTASQVTAEDSAAVTLPVRRQLVLSLARTDTSSVVDRAGAVVHMTVTASNTGNIHLRNITLSMTDVGDLTCSSPLGSDLLVDGTSLECSGSFAFSQDALEAGSRTFSAGGAGANLGGPAASNTVEVVVAASPGLQLDVDALNCTKPSRMREYCHFASAPFCSFCVPMLKRIHLVPNIMCKTSYLSLARG
jgi:hypothetical protein